MLSLPKIIRSDTVHTDNLKGYLVFNKPVSNHQQENSCVFLKNIYLKSYLVNGNR